MTRFSPAIPEADRAAASAAEGQVLRGRVFDVQRFSLHDGPGIRTTVFLKGCSLACFWCQNPEGLRAETQLLFTPSFCLGCGACFAACPNAAHARQDGRHVIDRAACTACGRCAASCPAQALRIVGKDLTVQEVLQAVLEDEPYYRASGGGVTLSGGEPLCQADFAAALLAECRGRGIHTAVDTSLAAPWADVEKLLPHTDLLLVDLKVADAERHRQVTGATNEHILANLGRLQAADVPMIVRMPIVPGVNDTPEAVSAVAELAARGRGLRYLELLPLHRLGETKCEGLGLPVRTRDLPPVGREKLRSLAAAAAACGVEVRGFVGNGQAVSAVAAQPPAPGELSFADRLEAIRRRKLEHTAVKREAGPRDLDDWGQIPLQGRAFHFEPQTDHPKGYVLGPRDCGRNFRRFCQAVPTYVDPMSSLLGGYYVTFDRYVTGWDPEAYWAHLAPEIEKYGIIDGIGNTQHFLSDVGIGLELGFGGLLRKIERYRRINTAADHQAYYDGLTEFVLGVQDWIRNHVTAAGEMAAAEDRPQLRRNLEEMAEINARLATDPPQTFREACQWLAWYQMAKRSYIGGGPIGRVDQVLHPYYRREVAAGTLTDDEAIFHLACLLVKDTHYIQLGGVDADGADATNPVSLLVLEAAHRLRIPANIAVAVHDGMDERLMRRAVELLFVDKMGIPRFSGHEAIVRGLVRAGWPMADARQRVQAGCHWFCLPGREYSFNDVIKVNFAKVLLAAMDEMMADRSGAASLSRLWELYDAHLRRVVEVVAEGIDYHMEHQHRFYPELALSLLCHGPIEAGVDASHGSLEYTYIGVDGAALATVADALAAIEQRIENESAVTWNELYWGLKHNWWRAGKVRMLMQTVPGYGRGGTRGDWWAERLSRHFSELVAARPSPAGHRMAPGIFSWASVLSMGRQTPATPDGRGAGEPISFGANPNPQRSRGGPLVPTAMSTAVARIQPGWGNPAPLQFDVDPGWVADEDGAAKFDAFLRTHFALGGTLVNANVLDRRRVLDACRSPEKYPDLVVRVTGFSAYFASLSDEFRRLVYDRIVAMEES